MTYTRHVKRFTHTPLALALALLALANNADAILTYHHLSVLAFA